METDKFEKQIRAKLQDRELNPSNKAWERISGELNSQVYSKKPIYLWMGIAASIVMLIGIALFYFNGAIQELDNPMEVVKTGNKDQLEIEQEKKALPIINQKDVVQTEIKTIELFEAKNKATNNKKTVADAVFVNVADESEVAVLEGVEVEYVNWDLKQSEQIINSKVAEIVAQVDVMEQFNNVTDAEVDSLLQRAQQEILRDKIFNMDRSVDAMALLTEVEDELDQSFRDQIFNSLKAGFIKVRTAVADRNN
jgi:predicted nucleic acid-binding protein